MSTDKWIVCEDLTLIKIGDIGLFKTVPNVEGWSILAHYKPTGELLAYRTKIPNISTCQGILSYLMTLSNPNPSEEEGARSENETEETSDEELFEEETDENSSEESTGEEPSALAKRRELKIETME